MDGGSRRAGLLLHKGPHSGKLDDFFFFMGLIGTWQCSHVGCCCCGLDWWLSWLTPDGTLWTQCKRFPCYPGGEGQRARVCVHLCVCAWRARGRGGGVGDCSPAPKRFVSAKRFPCPSQMAGHASPLAAEKEEQREHRRRSDTCVSA